MFTEANYGMIIRRNYIFNNGVNQSIGTQPPTHENCVNVRISDNSSDRTNPDGNVTPVEFYRNIVDHTDFSAAVLGDLILLWDHTDSASRHTANIDVYENQFWLRDSTSQRIRAKDQDVIPPGGPFTTDYQIWDLDCHYWDNEYHVTDMAESYWMWDTGTGVGVAKTWAEWQAIHTGDDIDRIQI
jgi:hypothetical protein